MENSKVLNEKNNYNDSWNLTKQNSAKNVTEIKQSHKLKRRGEKCSLHGNEK